ncbi:MAG: preprotein translocase subunit SecE [Bacteroidales bacterium]|nr:preprotein translocase subunit SecE [Bacteroidales bacterium]
MATAVQSSNTSTQSGNPRLKLVLSSVLGALFLFAGLFTAGYLVPQLLSSTLDSLGLGIFVNTILVLMAAVVVIGAFVALGAKVAGSNPPKGLRGGIFAVMTLAFVLFFIIRTVGVNVEGAASGGPITILVSLALLAGSYYFLSSVSGQNVMIALEEQGWFSAIGYKKTQGIRTRRYTMIGFLLIGWTGVIALSKSPFLVDASGPLVFDLPFTDTMFTTLPNVGYTLPLILTVLVFWMSWRAVNVPVFSDFLIATEAEMNKVSWSTRKQLVQDTIVVLTTVFLLTAFLFAVDWFWGTLLSSYPINVLPSPAETKQAAENAAPNW